MKNVKRQLRRYLTEQKLFQRLKLAAYKGYESLMDDEKRKGRCRKTGPFDCGNPQCYCCQYEKINKIPKISDLRKNIPEDV